MTKFNVGDTVILLEIPGVTYNSNDNRPLDPNHPDIGKMFPVSGVGPTAYSVGGWYVYEDDIALPDTCQCGEVFNDEDSDLCPTCAAEAWRYDPDEIAEGKLRAQDYDAWANL